MTSRRPRLEILDPAGVEAVVGEACRLLETIGVLVENAEARRLLEDRGARVVDGRHRVRERCVRDALEAAPARVVLHDRDGAQAVDLGGDRVHFDPGSAAIHLHDGATYRRREASSREVANLARLVDGLPHYAAQSTALTPADVPAEMADRWRLYLALRACRKPVVTGTFRADGFEPMRRMLAAVRGGEEALAARPLAVFDCCPSPPLRWSDLTAQVLIDCARAGIPATTVAMPLTGAAAPVTLHGTVVQHCAENLSGLAIHQAARPGAPFVYGGAAAAFDMRRGTTPMGAIETMMIHAACVQVGRHLELPTHAYLALSDAKVPDYQAGMETAMGAVIGALAGVNLISGPGILDYILTQSLEKLVLDHEACGDALRLIAGIDCSGEELAPLFAELVAKGSLLAHPHTRRCWRSELSVASAVIDRETYGDWEAGGARWAHDRAAAEVRRRLEAPPPPPLPPEVERELAAIMGAEATRCGLARLPPLD
ncbi:MAG: trimethylamine methyltransferase family protein [Acidobacteriota bacterium]|jgi:trimethylamine--corrinoid protein Co-methyltransferase